MARERYCGYLLKRINDQLEKNVNNVLRAQDLTMFQLGALLALSRAPEDQLSLKELERSLHIAQSTMAGVISRLELKGFVEPLANSADQRIKVVRITGAGRERISAAERHRAETEQRLLAGLTEAERSIFSTLLKKVHKSLQ